VRDVDLVVETTTGPVRGKALSATVAFLGIPYAVPPVGALRFRSPEPISAWREVRDATWPGPIAPQLPSRLARLMGDFDLAQSEDCLTLNIWTPTVGPKGLPVLVWFHGGAFTSGSGQLPWYSGETLARRGGIVVVSVSYRLGPLGFLYLPGVVDGNMGLQDQRAALRWIAANVARFGGDPGKITVSGQSAGARSGLILMGDDAMNDLFHRVILMSGPFGIRPSSTETVARASFEFAKALDLDPADLRALQSVPVDRLLRTAAEVAKRHRVFGNSRLPFDTVADGKFVPEDPAARALRGRALDIPVLVGTTRDESAAHLAFDPEAIEASEERVHAAAAAWLGDAAELRLNELQRLWPNTSPYSLLVHLVTDLTFLYGTVTFAENRATLGRPVYLYRFDWQSPLQRVGACHCIDLPFVFNNFDNWADAPMLAGGDPETKLGLAAAMQDSFISFIRDGSPECDATPPWMPYARPERMTMRFDEIIEPVGDLAGVRWRRSFGIS
jgi:para-nitrobenzyl esterase